MTVVFDHPEFDAHEQVSFIRDAPSGLVAILAVHRSRDGAAGGGVRFRDYADESDALADVLRLSRAMTWKFALAGVVLGGAKTVIIGDPRRGKTPALLRAFGRHVESLGGRYVCGPDVGTNSCDMDVIGECTRFAAGKHGYTGDTSVPTALGVFNALGALARHCFGAESLAGRRVAVQGAGGVGRALCGHLAAAGAEVMIADVDAEAAAAIANDCGATVVAPEAILEVEADLLAPCALGAILDERTIPRLRVRGICGGANNQLATPADGERLVERAIDWVPDYVASAGGAIAAMVELERLDEAGRDTRIAAIHDTVLAVFERATREGLTPDAAARAIAAERLAREDSGIAA